MVERNGERAGWPWGWLGGFLWVAIIGVIFLFQGKIAEGGIGQAIFVSALWATRYLAPWRIDVRDDRQSPTMRLARPVPPRLSFTAEGRQPRRTTDLRCRWRA